MTSDDMLAWLASRQKRDRPFELRSDSKMLQAWLIVREDEDFYRDVILRHGLRDKAIFSGETPADVAAYEHAIGNAWGHCVQALVDAWSVG